MNLSGPVELHAVVVRVLSHCGRIASASGGWRPAAEGLCETVTKGGHKEEVDEGVDDGVTHGEEHSDLLHRSSKLIVRHARVAERVRPRVESDGDHEDKGDDESRFRYRHLHRLQRL